MEEERATAPYFPEATVFWAAPHEVFDRPTARGNRTTPSAVSQAPRPQRQFAWPPQDATVVPRPWMQFAWPPPGATAPRFTGTVWRPPHDATVVSQQPQFTGTAWYRNGGFGAVPASGKAIAALAETTAGEAREKGCSVCLEGFEEGERLSTMPCSHAFHEGCITDWLRVSRVCPLCRFRLPTEADEEQAHRRPPSSTCT